MKKKGPRRIRNIQYWRRRRTRKLVVRRVDYKTGKSTESGTGGSRNARRQTLLEEDLQDPQVGRRQCRRPVRKTNRDQDLPRR